MSSEVIKKFNEAVDELLQYETGDQLRDRLIADGITGVPGECHACPVAVWLIRQLHVEPQLISVDQESCQLWSRYDREWSLERERTTPWSVRQFINTFDGLACDLEPSDYVDNDKLRSYLPILRREVTE